MKKYYVFNVFLYTYFFTQGFLSNVSAVSKESRVYLQNSVPNSHGHCHLFYVSRHSFPLQGIIIQTSKFFNKVKKL